MILRTRGIGALLMLGLFAGCADSQDATEATRLDAGLVESPYGPALRLDRSPNQVADDRPDGTVQLESDLTIDGLTEEIGQLEDARFLSRGRIALLDGRRHHVAVFGPDGSRVHEWGRDGHGPGDLADPRSLTPLGDGVVVLQQAGENLFTYFDGEGDTRVRANAPVPGDWGKNRYRGYTFDTWGRQEGPLDSDRVLGTFGDSVVIILLQVDEGLYRESDPDGVLESPPGALISLDSDFSVVDTLAEVIGTPIRSGQFGAPWATFYVPTYAPTPVWATGDGWFAIGDGRSPHLVVHRISSSDSLVVRWPRRPRPVVREDLEATARWLLSIQVTNSSQSEGRWARMSRAERRDAIPWTIESNLLDPADVAPEVSGLAGAGRCLFIAGFDPHAWQTAVSRRWIVLDVLEPRLLGVVELPARPAFNPAFETSGISLRDVSDRSLLAAYRTEMGAAMVERFPLPFDCGEGRGDEGLESRE